MEKQLSTMAFVSIVGSEKNPLYYNFVMASIWSIQIISPFHINTVSGKGKFANAKFVLEDWAYNMYK